MWSLREHLPPNHGRYQALPPGAQRAPPGAHGYARRQSIPALPVQAQRNVSMRVQTPAALQNHYHYQQQQQQQQFQQFQQPQQQQQQQHHQNHHHHHQGLPHSFSAPWSGFGFGDARARQMGAGRDRSRDRHGGGGGGGGERPRVWPPQDMGQNDNGGTGAQVLVEAEAPRVYNYMPRAYWCGRLSSVMDRLAAEYPDETRAWRVGRAMKGLGGSVGGEGAKKSLVDFKAAFERRVRKGSEW